MPIVLKKSISVILAVLVLVLLMSHSFMPRAEASVGAGMAVAGAVAASPALSVLSVIVLAAAGVDFVQGVFGLGDEGLFYGSGVYEVGAAFGDAIDSASAFVSSWFATEAAAIEASGGITAGAELTIPAEVREFARQWALETYDFTSGTVSITQSGIYSGSEYVIFSEVGSLVSTGGANVYRSLRLGTAYPIYETSWAAVRVAEFIHTNGYAYKYGYYTQSSGVGAGQITIFSERYLSGTYVDNYVFSPSVITKGDYSRYVLTYIVVAGFLRPALYDKLTGELIDYPSTSGSNPAWMSITISNTATATMSKTTVMDNPLLEDVRVKYPEGTYTDVGALSIPIIAGLTLADILADIGTGEPITPEVPPVGEGDLDGLKLPDLSRVFPFCVPYDLIAIFEMLNAPAEAPLFVIPINMSFVGYQGEIVVDVSDYEAVAQVIRWGCTIAFLLGLTLVTRKLIKG